MPSSILNGVQFWVMSDSGIVEANPREGPVATVKLKCLTTDRYALIKGLVGSCTVAGSTITRTYPFQYPPSPNLICRSIENIEMQGPPILLIPNSAWMGKQYSILTVRFEPAWFFNDNSDPSGKPYTSTSLNMSAEAMTLPQSTYTFPSGAPTNTPVARQIPQIQISMRRFMLPFLPINEMAAILGRVNDAVFTVGKLVCPIGTVLFMGGPSEFTADSGGVKTYTVTYEFLYRAIPWNQYMSPNPTEGYATPVDGTGNPVFPSGNFATLP